MSRVLEDRRPVVAVAAAMGVSRRIVYKWIKRYCDGGVVGLPDERQESACAFLQRAVQWFSQFGITIKRVLTDNGSCYKSKLWHATSKKLGVRVKKTRPYRPQTNGKAERFIQTLLREWAYFRVYVTSNERMAVLPIYLTHYNQHRDHSSLKLKPPITRMPGVYNVAGIHS